MISNEAKDLIQEILEECNQDLEQVEEVANEVKYILGNGVDNL